MWFLPTQQECDTICQALIDRGLAVSYSKDGIKAAPGKLFEMIRSYHQMVRHLEWSKTHPYANLSETEWRNRGLV